MFFKREISRHQKLPSFFGSNPNILSKPLFSWPIIEARCYSGGAWDKFSLPNIFEYLENGGFLSRAQSECGYSILSPKFVTRELSDIREIFRVFGTTEYALPTSEYRQLRDLVVFRPERLLLHEIMISISTQCQIRNDTHFNELANSLLAQTRPQLSKLNFDMEYTVAEIQASVRNRLSTGSYLHESSQDLVDKIIQNQYNIAVKRPSSNVESIVEKSSIDILIKNYYAIKVNGVVNSALDKRLAAGNEKELTLKSKNERENIVVGLTKYTNSKRLSFMVAGGPATGKSTLTGRIILMLKEKGIQLQDYCMIAPDRYLFLLSDKSVIGNDSRLHATLLQEECRLISENIQRRLLEMLETNKEAPNVFIEMLVPYDDKVELATYGGGRFKIYVTSYPPVQALEGGYARFKDTGRFVPKEYVLEGQKRVSAYLPSLSNKYLGSGRKIYIEIHDTYCMIKNTDITQRSIIASLEPSNNITTIYDLNKMLEFLGKKHINVDSKNAAELLQNNISLTDMLHDFIGSYAFGIVKFVSKEFMRDGSSESEKHVYAIYRHDIKEIEILQPNNFNMMMQEKIYLTLFKLLDESIASTTQATLENREFRRLSPGTVWTRQ